MTGNRPLSVFIVLAFFILSNVYLCSGKSKLVDLNEDNWHEMLKGEWMVEFFAPWCPACKALQPIWKDFASWSDDLEIKVGQVDVTASPGLSGRFMVTALPTIFHIQEGVFRQYRGSREKEEFMSFIEEKKWQNLEEIPAWKSPASYQMSVISQFFKMSMFLRGVHTSLVEEYGLPIWGSYLVFALATIFIGAVLGLVLVCIIDFLFPPKVSTAPFKEASGTAEEKIDEEDLSEEEEEEEEEVVEEEETAAAANSSDEEKHKKAESEKEKSESEGGGSHTENSEPEANSASASNSPSVRKRRPRKAD